LITAARGFAGHVAQIRGNGLKRFGVLAKSRQLRMTRVSSRLTGDDFLGQESFAPERNQSLGVEISRVNSPKAHGIRTLYALTTRAMAGCVSSWLKI